MLELAGVEIVDRIDYDEFQLLDESGKLILQHQTPKAALFHKWGWIPKECLRVMGALVFVKTRFADREGLF